MDERKYTSNLFDRDNALDELRHIGKTFGWSDTYLQTLGKSSSSSKLFFQTIQKNVNEFSLKVQIEEHMVEQSKNRFVLDIKWSVIKNLYGVELKLLPEKGVNRIKKKIGGQDIEIFEQDFDEQFIIQCNYKGFPMLGFSKRFKTELLKVQDVFGELKIGEYSVSYTEELVLAKYYDGSDHLINIIKAMEYLAHDIEKWRPRVLD
ncbi:MAG: hypothetical protein GY810_23705 [Aureispira sp.]|nr:hypothetical protein [Aureispira sp.]